MGDPGDRAVRGVPEPAPAPGAGLAALKEFRARLIKSGRLIEARTVARCIVLLKAAA